MTPASTSAARRRRCRCIAGRLPRLRMQAAAVCNDVNRVVSCCSWVSDVIPRGLINSVELENLCGVTLCIRFHYSDNNKLFSESIYPECWISARVETMPDYYRLYSNEFALKGWSTVNWFYNTLFPAILVRALFTKISCFSG